MFHIRHLNSGDEGEIEFIALKHQSAPLDWMPDFKVDEAHFRDRLEDIRAHARDENRLILVAEGQDGQVLGFHWLDFESIRDELVAHIKSLWVTEECRGLGIARALKQAGENWAIERGALYLKTSLHYNNKRMLAINLAAGFEPGFLEMTKNLQ